MMRINIKYSIAIVLTLFGFTLFAQKTEVLKPEYVIIADNELISEERLGELMQEGYIKSMNKGVSQDFRDEFAKKYGEKIGEKEFVIIVELFTENEKPARIQEPTNIEENNDAGYKLYIGDFAKDFTVEMVDGTSLKLSDLKGKIVLLNFWATWCAPCLMEFYEIPDKILEPFANTDFVFLPVSIGENKEKVKNKMLQLNKNGIVFNAGIDPDEKIWNEYASMTIPKNFLIDRNGTIRYVSTGNSEGNIDKLAEEIEKLLKE